MTTDEKVHLTTVIGSFVRLFPFMINHYRELGITSLLVNAHLASDDDPFGPELRRVAREIDCPIASTRIGKWQAVSRKMYTDSRSSRPDDWFILADQDELQCYPDDLFEILRWCDSKGYDYIRGCFVDRVTGDGALGEVREEVPIWEQFPLAGQITFPVAKSNPHKIVAAKGHVKIGHGQHDAFSGTACPIDDVLVQVHHFKWTAGLYEHLRARILMLQEEKHPHWRDSALILAHLDANGGRFDVTAPELMMEECGRRYSQWEFVREAVRQYDAISANTHA